MQVAFLPTSLDKISPTISIAEAVHRLIDGSASRDHVLHFNPETFEMGWWHEGRLVTPKEYEELTAGYMATYQRACLVFIDGAHKGELRSYVWSNERNTLFHVPRFYWGNRQTHELGEGLIGMEDAVGWDATMANQPLLLSEAEFYAWKARVEHLVHDKPEARPAAPAKKPVSKPDLRKWIRQRIREGAAKVQLETERMSAFPNNLPPGRNMVRELFDEQLYDLKKKQPSRGRPVRH